MPGTSAGLSSRKTKAEHDSSRLAARRRRLAGLGPQCTWLGPGLGLGSGLGWRAGRLAGSGGAALDLPRGELLARDCHLGGAQIEDLEHVGLVVLRGETEQPAAPLQPGQRSLQREVASGLGLGLGLRLRLRLGLGLSAALGFSGLQREVVRLEGDAACPLLRHRAAPQRAVAVAHEHLERIAQLARHTPGQGWS